jgi:hypothetical protein
MVLVAGVRWASRGNDAGSLGSRSYRGDRGRRSRRSRPTSESEEVAALSATLRHSHYFAKPS